MKYRRLATPVVLFFSLLSSAPVAMAQELTAQQKARILKRFPQIDKNGDGQLSADELKPYRKQLEKAQKRLQQQSKPAKSKPQGPVPTHADLQYGDHKETVMDVWLADSIEPTPVVVAIHGGGFTGGDKSKYHGCEELLECLEKGVSFVSINYRFRNQDPDGIRACLSDSARAIQFIRHHAKEWNLDKARLAAFGGSAGAGTSLWLACHDDLADPSSSDPVLRESTRLVVAGLNGTQATYDVLQWPDFIPSKIKWSEELAKARGADMTSAYGIKSMDELDSDSGKKIRKELDMLAWMSKDDPPIWMKNNQRGGPTDPQD
ncbi:MAG: alpha/beta hydrolase fold domain-containing protein, partial [Planctomycetota bacterium]